MAVSNRLIKAKTQMVRLNLQLEMELKEALDRQAEKSKTTTPELARDFLRQGLEIMRQKELDEQLTAGYQYLAKENRQLLEEFGHIDRESWEQDDENKA